MKSKATRHAQTVYEIMQDDGRILEVTPAPQYRSRKLQADDMEIMSRLIRDVGRATAANMLLMMCGEEINPRYRHRCYKFGAGPLQFIRSLLEDYTGNAVINAICSVKPAKRDPQPPVKKGRVA